jgi:hypothetical protein
MLPASKMKTATSVLATVPASFRNKRQQPGAAEQQLRNLEQATSDFDLKQLAYGVLYSDSTGRISGTISMALRRATPWNAAKLIAAMANDGLTLVSEVPYWMNANALSVLS